MAGLLQHGVSPQLRRATGALACLLAAYFSYSLIDQTMYHLLPLLHFAMYSGLFVAGLAQARAAGSYGLISVVTPPNWMPNLFSSASRRRASSPGSARSAAGP